MGNQTLIKAARSDQQALARLCMPERAAAAQSLKDIRRFEAGCHPPRQQNEPNVPPLLTCYPPSPSPIAPAPAIP